MILMGPTDIERKYKIIGEWMTTVVKREENTVKFFVNVFSFLNID